MARVSPQELLSRLEKGKIIPGILLLGDEPYLRDTCRAQLIEKFVPEASRTWAVSRYSAERGETEAALSQAQSLPMLSPQQVVFLEDADAIEELGDKNREETVAQLELYLGDPAPFTVLVIEAARLSRGSEKNYSRRRQHHGRVGKGYQRLGVGRLTGLAAGPEIFGIS